MPTGQCHCGAIRYEMPADVIYHALCHCSDCRHHAGAPMVAWALVPQDAVTVTGTPKIYASSDNAQRHFCGDCGSSLFYTNGVMFPGMIDIQTATLDDPGAIPVSIHVQTAEAISWMATAHELPKFERYPEGP